jgi:hypothetical protein
MKLNEIVGEIVAVAAIYAAYRLYSAAASRRRLIKIAQDNVKAAELNVQAAQKRKELADLEASLQHTLEVAGIHLPLREVERRAEIAGVDLDQELTHILRLENYLDSYRQHGILPDDPETVTYQGADISLQKYNKLKQRELRQCSAKLRRSLNIKETK